MSLTDPLCSEEDGDIFSTNAGLDGVDNNFMTEHDIQTTIINYLKTREDIFFWRNNAGRKNYMQFGLKGSCDILGIIKPTGKLLGIEIKTEKGKVSPEQTNFINKVNEMGGIAFVARNLDEVKERLQICG